MNTHADKSQNPENKSVATPKKHKNGPATFQLMDKRSEAVTQRKLQKMANESNQVSPLRSIREKANQSSPKEKNPIQKKPNTAGLPDNLKTGIENLSGYSMDDVKVHYNSAKPAQLNAHAYAQGTNIHLASGQEKHLPHEAWHVVQQKQGRVKPTMQMKGGTNVNDDIGLEKEADVMGNKAINIFNKPYYDLLAHYSYNQVTQRVTRPSRVNRTKKNKKKQRTNKNTSTGTGFSYIEHYTHKLPQVFDLITSFRRQRMLITSTLTREYLHKFQNGSLSNVPINEITLLHPNSLEDTKTRKRYEIILNHLKQKKSTNLSNQDIGKLIPSDEGIQVAKVAANRYVSMQGVGRIVAIKEAAKNIGKELSIEIMTYDLSNMPIIPGQLEAIAASYHTDEGLMSKTFGTMLGIGLPSFLLNYFSGGKLVLLASWLASYIVKQMENDVLNVNSSDAEPFAYSYPRGGTRIDG